MSTLSTVSEQVHPYMAIMFHDDDGIFQHGNAPCHTVRIDFKVLPWPPNSPDLNPIENLWDYIDGHIRRMDPPPRNLHELRDAILSTWSEIPTKTFRGLLESLLRRLTTVRAAKDGYSGY